MANGQATAEMNARIAKIKEFQLAVFRESAQRTVDLMQEPGPSKASTRIGIAAGAGLGKVKKNGQRGDSRKAYGLVHVGGAGNLPIDTGFLRASLIATLGAPSFPLRQRPEDQGAFQYDGEQIVVVISNARITDVVSTVYTAAYAAAVEYGARGRQGYRFVGLAAQQWPQTVAQVSAEAKAKAGL